jgi:hypothetical protein
MCLPSRCLTLNVYSNLTIPAFGRHVTTPYSKMPSVYRLYCAKWWNDSWMIDDSDELGRNLLSINEVISRHLFRGTEENYEKPRLLWLVYRSRFENRARPFLSWGWTQQVPPNHWHLSTKINGVTFQKIAIQLILVSLIPFLQSTIHLCGCEMQTAERLIFPADCNGLYRGE